MALAGTAPASGAPGKETALSEGCDPEATVRVMMQEHWPFECAVAGVAVRAEFSGEAEGCICEAEVGEEHTDDCPAGGEAEWGDGCEANDVFIVEGAQQRYGDKRAWEVAHC